MITSHHNSFTMKEFNFGRGAAVVSSDFPVRANHAVARHSRIMIFIEGITDRPNRFWPPGRACNIFIGKNFSSGDYFDYLVYALFKIGHEKLVLPKPYDRNEMRV